MQQRIRLFAVLIMTVVLGGLTYFLHSAGATFIPSNTCISVSSQSYCNPVGK